MRHNHIIYYIVAVILPLCFSCKSTFRDNGIKIRDLNDSIIFEIIGHKEPVIKKGDKGTEDNRYGFEGGRVMKIDNMYQMFVAEMVDTPRCTKMKLAHWKSQNGIDWKRVSTLYESSGDYSGTDPRAALWSPMPFYNKEEGRWNMFYVAYKSKPNNDTAFFVNHEGRIWRAVSKTPGEQGYGGPYQDVGIVLEPGKDSDSWEGLQGVDSYFIYEANKKFYAFYGTASTQKKPIDFWGAGLASAPSMAGPWKRCTELNPIDAKTNFFENAIVTNLDDGTYLAIFDCGGCDGFGYILSKDGVNWSKAHFVKYEPAIEKWWTITRTPLCLIKEEDGTYTTFYTAFTGTGNDYNDYDNFEKNIGFASVGMIRFKISNSGQK
jgi:hypothetical protein